MRSPLHQFILAMYWLHLLHKTQAKQYCHQVSFIKTNWSDTPPRYIVQMNFTKDGTFSVYNTVNDIIAVPVSRMLLTQSDKDRTTVLYNATTKLCDLRQFFDRMPMFSAIAQTILKTSNYTFACPLQKGVYVINEFRVKNRHPLLGIIYDPKKTITFSGGMFEEMPDKSLRKLNVYNIVLRIVKRPCV